MATPRPTPTALRVLRGDTSKGKNPIPKHEPRLPPEVPQPPKSLRDKVARDEWRRVSRVLLDMGVLTRADGNALALFCDCYSLYVEAMAAVARVGLTVTYPSGVVAQNPAVSVAQKARMDMLRFLCEFGLTPASRTRISVLPEERDGLEEFLSATPSAKRG